MYKIYDKKISNLVILVCITHQIVAQDSLLSANLRDIAIQEQMAGMSVIAIRADTIVYEGYFGSRDIGRNLPTNVNTKYRIAPISKTFSAIALMKLYEQNLFQLDDDVSPYLGFTLRNPNFPSDKITFRMLLSHTSSVQDGTGYDAFLAATFSGSSVPPISNLLTTGGINYTSNMFRTEKPGTYFNYSNVQFGIVGTLVERISNQRFDIYIKQNILTPLGITGSFNIDDLSPSINDLATIYRKVSNVWSPQFDNYLGVAPTPKNYSGYTIGSNGLLFGPQGSLRASAKDLALMIAMISKNGVAPNGNRILNDSTVRLMRKAQYTYTTPTSGNNYGGLFRSWGLGLQISTANATNDQIFVGKKMWGHAGEAYGLISNAYIDTATKTGVIFITNGKFGSYTSCNTQFYCVEEKVFNAVNTYLLTVLPLRFLDFSAKIQENNVQLNWTTENEVNNKVFDIEKSFDGKNFKVIAFESAKFSVHETKNNYTFIDKEVESSLLFYRIKQIDINGKNSYSKTISINKKISGIEIMQISPNPSMNKINIDIQSSKANKATAVIADLSGKVVKKQQIDLVEGLNFIQINTIQLAKGNFLLKLMNDQNKDIAIKKFLKE